MAYVLNDLCRLYTCRGEFEKAYQVIAEARELWRSLDNQVMLADSFGSEAEARFNAGQFDLSLQCSQEALQITEIIENLWGQSYDRMLMAFVLLEKGELGQSIQLAEKSVRLADSAGLIASAIGLASFGEQVLFLTRLSFQDAGAVLHSEQPCILCSLGNPQDANFSSVTDYYVSKQK